MHRANSTQPHVKRIDVQASCEGKQRYESHSHAAMVWKARHQRGTTKGGIGIYRCRHCTGWHMGRQPPKHA